MQFAVGLGMDALNVALNALAVLFILEIDNTAYMLGLTDRQRAWLETIEVRRAVIDGTAAPVTRHWPHCGRCRWWSNSTCT